MADTTAIKEITAKLESGINDLFESDKYTAYLQTMSRFHRYSTRNTLLIHMQNPEATRVAGYNDWKNKFKRQVKKGERGIKILAPTPFLITKELDKIDPETQRPIIGEDGQPVREEVEIRIARFKTVSVFDISQTEGEPLPTLAENITGDVARYDLFMDSLRAVSPLPIQFEDLPPETDGLCRFGDRISIRNGMSEIQTVSAAIHEIVHAKLHDAQIIKENGGDPKDRRTEEVESESISYSVCQFYGIETGANTFGYIAEWSRGRELKELNASLDTIRKTAAELIDGIDEQYRALAKERGIDLSIEAPMLETDNTVSPSSIQETEPYVRGGINNDARLAAVRERYGQDSYQYETIKQDMEMSFEEYADMVARLDAEIDKRGYTIDDDEYTSQDYLNDYIDEIDLHPEAGDAAKIADYIAGRMNTLTEPEQAREATAPARATITARIPIPDYGAFLFNGLPISDANPAVGASVLLQPVFDGGNFNRDGKRIRVTVEKPIGKYLIFSRDEGDDKQLYFLTASGMIDHTREYFRDVWDDETHKWVNYRPTEAEFDEVLPLVAERFEKDMADPTKWAKYQHAAALNRIGECDEHNEPVRKLRDEESKAREAAAEIERQEREIEFQEKYDGRIDEIATAIGSGKTISVGYDEYEYGGKNPVLDLFKLYGIDLPLRTQGWVNTGLAEITDGSYRYYKSKHKGNSTAFGGYLEKLREAIQATPIEEMRQKGNTTAKTEVKSKLEHELYEKLSELFPDFMDRKYSYLRLESNGFEPLSLEWVFGDRISVMHTYTLNGDLCYDPMVEFIVNSTEKTLTATVFQQSIPPLYQYHDDDGIGRSVDGNGNERVERNLRSQINEFSAQWFQNISEQGFMPVKATLWNKGGIDDVDVRVTFDDKGSVIMPEPETPDSEYSIGYGFYGGGITVWNSAPELKGEKAVDIALIKPDRSIVYYDENIPDDVKSGIEHAARTINDETFDIPPINEASKDYDLGYGFLGNGITVWNRAEERDGDYATVAHIATDRTVTFYDKDMPHEVRQRIDTVANSPDTWAHGFSRAPENVPPHIDGAATTTSVYETVKMVFLETANPKQAGLDMSLPDPLWTAAEMFEYGYTEPDMYPLSVGRAVELFDTDHPIYLLYPDNTEALAIDRDEIITFSSDGFCGITHADWEVSKVRAAQLSVAANAQGRREAELLHGDGNRFGIYQIRDSIDDGFAHQE